MTKTKQKPGTKIIVFGKREKKLFEEFASGTTQEQLGLICGVSPQTLLNVMERQPEFRHLYDKLQAELCGKMANNLVTRAETSDSALIFFLKMRHPLFQEKKEADSGLTGKITIHRMDGSVDPVKE